MVELFENQLKDFSRQSSKGNQLKWENDGIWYKADYTGYEGLAEFIVSQLLKKSSLGDEEYITYELENIQYKRSVYNGVRSENFIKDGEQLITLERLYKLKKGTSFLQAVWHFPEVEDRLDFFVNEVVKLTGLEDFGIYLSKMLTIDAFFLNEDRHMHNIAVLMKDDSSYRLCPVFDNGASLLSDTKMDYPLVGDIFEMMDEVKAKTLCSDFDEQLDAVEKKFGYNIKFSFTKKDVDVLLAQADMYPEEVIERVRTILYQRIRKYGYLFG